MTPYSPETLRCNPFIQATVIPLSAFLKKGLGEATVELEKTCSVVIIKRKEWPFIDHEHELFGMADLITFTDLSGVELFSENPIMEFARIIEKIIFQAEM